MPHNETCEHCRWWDTSWFDKPDGECRRRAPSPIYNNLLNKILYPDIEDNALDLSMDDARCDWPVTRYEDWCGDFTLRTANPSA